MKRIAIAWSVLGFLLVSIGAVAMPSQQGVTDFERTATAIFLQPTLTGNPYYFATATASKATEESVRATSFADLRLTMHTDNLTSTAIEHIRETKAPTRTAIAIERNPSLFQSSTPAPVNLTVTHAFMNHSQGITSTGIIECQFSLGRIDHNEEEIRLNFALEQIGRKYITEIYSFGVDTVQTMPDENCNDPAIHQTYLNIFTAHDNPLEQHPVVIEETLKVLHENELQIDSDSQPVRLGIHIFTRFYSPFQLEYSLHHPDSYMIDTDYHNAIDAYGEGLRGDELIKALGGLLPY